VLGKLCLVPELQAEGGAESCASEVSTRQERFGAVSSGSLL